MSRTSLIARPWFLAFVPLAAVVVFAGPRASVEPISVAASGDTVVVYGPLQQFAGAVRVERMDVPVDPTRRYTLRVRNGAPDGSSRATGGRITFDNWAVLSSSELGTGQYEWDKVVQPRGGDTLVINVTGSSGSYVTVDLLETADASYALFGPERFTRDAGRPEVYTRTLNVSAADAAPYRLCLLNGNPDGTQRLSNATIRLNGTEVVSPAQGFSGRVASLVRDVPLVQGSNALEITLPAQPTGFIDVCATATDVTPPVVAIATPVPGFVTRDTQVTVSGSVEDQTTTRITVNGQPATRSGKGYSAVVSLSADGPKTIHVAATDGAGLTTDSTRMVIRDTQQPRLTVDAPADHSSTADGIAMVSGSATDLTAVTVNANGVSLPVDTVGRFAGSVPLADGPNVVTVTATDAAGNQAVVLRSVTRQQLVTRQARPTMMAGPLGPSSWPNEPAGSSVVTDQPWDSLIHGWTIEGRDTANLKFATDASAPFSPTGVLQARFPVGDSGGVLGNVLYRPTDVPPTPRVYMGIWWKISKPWHAPGPTIQYLSSDLYGHLSMQLVDSTVSDSGPYKLEVSSVNYLKQNVNPNVSVSLGVWHKIEWLVDFSNTLGKVQWWLDGVQLGSYSNEPVPAGLVFNQWSSSVEWHQWATPKPQTDYFWYDHTHISVPPARALPPDPATVATKIDSTVTTTVFASTGFLYTGTNPIQTGVASGTINLLRAAVVRGRTLARDGTALSGVAVTILGRPEFGQTLSRADGRYDLAVNGGGPLTVALNKTGFLSAQRAVDVPWQDFVSVDDVVMIPVDGTVTTIDFASPTEVARGSVVHDTSGTRQGTLIFKQGTQATMILPNGSQQPLTSMNVRVTEFTVGTNGPNTMPAPLPPASAYTYAAEFSADEAISAGATSVSFSQAVPFYLENFLGFPVGIAVPMGWYDRTRAAWIPSQNGRVVQIVSVTNGMANLDITGDGVADDATPLGVNDAERQRLALLYTTGQKLWRIPVSHFSPGDPNYPPQTTSGQTPPNTDPATGGGGGGGGAPGDKQNQKKDKDNPCKSGGSIVECENQTLGEAIHLVGTAFSLNYRSDRVPGRIASHELVIPLSRDTLPPGLVLIRLQVSVAGQVFEDSFPPQPDLQTRFQWDGKDVYGRTVLGIQPVTVRIGYDYQPQYAVPAAGDTSFGKAGQGPVAVNTRQPYTISRSQRTTLGTFDPRAQGFGGWTFSVHHAYDPIGGVLYLGDGTRRSALTLGQTISTVAGDGVNTDRGDGGPATRASISSPEVILPAPDGSLYITGPLGLGGRVRKVGPDGVISTVAGNGSQFVQGPDSGVAVQMSLNGPWGLALAADGSLYIAEWNGSKIRRVKPDGMMITVAGTGVFGYSGDGGPATAAALNEPVGLAFGPDGSLYIGDSQNHRVRRIGPDGIITTVAGNGTGGFGGDGGSAVSAMLNFPSGVAVSARGVLYIADADNNRIRRVSAGGVITTLAGNGTSGFSGDGGPATLAALGSPEAVSLGASGEVYIGEDFSNRVRMVTPDGTIRTVAGSGTIPATGDGGSPVSAGMSAMGIAVGPDGTLYVADANPNNRIRAIKPTPPGLGTGEILIAAADGSEFYRFSSAGRHLSTIDARTADTTFKFSYSSAGWLTGITDADNNVTTIARDAAGVPQSITSPFSAQTTLGVNSEGFLNRVTDPAGQVTALHYVTGGLLDTLTTPRGFKHRFAYDSVGRLARDQGPSGEDLTIVRTELATATETRMTTAEGRSTVYHLEGTSTGGLLRKTTNPAGLISQVLVARSDSLVSTEANGTVTTMTVGADPRAGLLAATLHQVTTQTPGGRTMVVTGRRVTTRPDSTNPLSLTSQVDSVSLNGQWSVTSYTASTRRLVTTSPEARQRFATLDAKGRVIATQTAGLDSTRFSYDNLGRLSQRQVGGRVFTYTYDTRGRLVSTLDPLGRRDSLFYDGADRVVRRVLLDGRVVQFAYDSSGNVTGVTPPSRPVHSFQYTASDVAQEYDPPGIPGPKPTRYFYNRDKQVDSVARPDSITVRFAYDAGGRPSSVTFDRGTLTFGYDPTTGNLRGIRTPTGDSVALSYDGSLPTQTRWVGAVTGTVAFTFDNNFRVSSQTVNGANMASFGYDRDGLLRSAGAMRLGRSPTNGLLLADTLGPVIGTYQYTSRGELKGYHMVRNGTTLLGAGYVRDSLGRITQLFDTAQGTPTRWTFVYDSGGRVAADSVNGTVFHVFTYDPNGSRLTFTSSNGTVNYTYDAQDRLLSAGTTTYSYSSNGELKTKTVSGVGTTTYTYDALGNLVAVVLPNATRIDYVIDGQNRRVGQKINGVLAKAWLYQDQLNPIAELDGTGNLVSRFVYGSRTNVPDYFTKNGVTYRLVTDLLGSVRLVVDTATGTVAQRIDYDEWGNVTQNTNPGLQPFGFVGGVYDGQTGLVRFGARDYSPEVARWLAKDPIGFAGGPTNLYSYGNADPVNGRDPSGLDFWLAWHDFTPLFNHALIWWQAGDTFDPSAFHVTFGAGPETDACPPDFAFFGCLNAGFDRPTDYSQEKAGCVKLLLPYGISEEEMLDRLFNMQRFYMENWNDQVPYWVSVTSNSYAHGLANAAGFSGVPTSVPKAPGWGSPLPRGFFTP